MMRRIWFWRLWFAGMVAPMALLGYWAFIDVGPAATVESYRLLTPMPVRPGDEIAVARRVCILYPSAPGVVNRQFVDGLVFNTPVQAAELPAQTGCHERVFPFEIPGTLPPGRYRYEAVGRYRINPITVSRVDLGTVEIEVVRP